MALNNWNIRILKHIFFKHLDILSDLFSICMIMNLWAIFIDSNPWHLFGKVLWLTVSPNLFVFVFVVYFYYFNSETVCSYCPLYNIDIIVDGGRVLKVIPTLCNRNRKRTSWPQYLYLLHCTLWGTDWLIWPGPSTDIGWD